MSWELKPGDEVVCIDDSHWTQCLPKPVRGGVYTIREIRTEQGEAGLRFDGLVSVPTNWWLSPPGGEFYFQSKYFRPLRKRETSIEIFKALLTPSHQKEEA